MSDALSTAIYCRISRDRTGLKAGVERQEEDSRKLAAERGWPVLEVLVDNDTSASRYGTKSRPAYQRLVEGIKSGRYQAVIAWHPDRLYRRPRDLEDLVDVLDAHLVAIATVKAGQVDLTTASGRLNARMLGNVAAYESEIKSERVTRAAEQRAKAGKWSGGMRPYGYEVDGVTIREAEARHMRAAFADVLDGVSLRETVRRRNAEGALTTRSRNADGVLTDTGRSWTAQHARGMMLSPRYAGLSTYQGQIVCEAGWPAIVAEDDWRRVRAILSDPARRTTPGPTPRHLLSGIAICGVPECGKPCRVSVVGGASKRYMYRCPHGHVVRSKHALEQYVTEAALVRLEAAEVRAAMPEPSSPANAPADAEVLRRRLDELAEDYAEGILSREQLRAGSTRTRELLAQAEAAIAASSLPSPVDRMNGQPPREAWEAMALEHRRAVLSELFRVVLHPMPSGKRGVNADGVTLLDASQAGTAASGQVVKVPHNGG